MSNETLRTVDGRHVLRIERRLAHPPAKVWRAVTEPAELSQWFPATVTMELQAGAAVHFEDETGPGTAGRVVELDPPRVLVLDWEGDLLRFELHPDGDGCLLRFTHTFDDRSGAASFASGWHECLNALEHVVDGRAPEPAHPSAELHDTYVEQFGLDEGATEVGPDGWTVRFERQMTRPIETVWAALQDAGAAPTQVGGPVPSGFTAGAVPAGTVTRVDAPRVLEYDWWSGNRPAGRIRWELSAGTGHGARLVVTQTGSPDVSVQRSVGLTAWRERLGQLAHHLRTSKD